MSVMGILTKLSYSFIKESDWSKIGSGGYKTICSDPGNCGPVSYAFKDWLDERGIKSSIICAQFTGLIGEDIVAHVAVEIGTTVVDLTMGQFYKPNKIITYMGSADAWEDELNRLIKYTGEKVEDIA